MGQLSNTFGQGQDEEVDFVVSLPGEPHDPDADASDGPAVTAAAPDAAAAAGTGDSVDAEVDADVGDEVDDEVTFDLASWSALNRDAVTERLRTAGVPHWWVEATLHAAAGDGAVVDGIIDELDDDVPTLDAGEDQVAYDMSEWDDDRLDTLADRLDAAGIPFGWDGDELFVHAADEAAVDDLVDAVEHPDELAVEPDADDGDTSATLLGDLFVAADRIQHDATEHEPVAMLLLLSERVDGDRPPYGLGAREWGHVSERVDLLADLLCEDDRDEDAVMTAASDLRTSLRRYV